jgi:ATP-binding cassette, subfamily B, bacterial
MRQVRRLRSPRLASRRAARRELARAFPGRTASLALLALLSGALPAVFAALVGVLVGQLPAVVRHGFGSAAGHHAVAALIAIAVVLILIELTSGARDVISTDLYRRFDGYLLGRVMSAALSRDDLALFDDPDLAASLDRGVQLARYGPGELVSGLSYQWTVRSQGLAAAVLVGLYWPVAAVALTALWLVVARAQQTSYYRADPFWTDPLRRARYVQRIGLLPPWAKEVRIFGLVGWLVEQYGREWSAVMAQLWRTRRADYRPMALLGAVVLGAHVAVLLLLARSATAGVLPVSELVIVLQGLFGMTLIASLAGDTWIENGSVPVPDVLSLERVVRASERPDEGRPDEGRRDEGRRAAGLPRQAISFQGVSFGYPSRDTLVLADFDLRLRAGQSVAIVGLNGAGKTTLVKLLTGLCRPTAGTIAVDGIDLADLDLASWRRQLAVIFQDFVRYELPLTDNIIFGSIEHGRLKHGRLKHGRLEHVRLDPAELTDIAAQAGAADLLAALPGGSATILSPRFEGGVDLSGGQWQRVAFARALMAVRAGARVLVMDEPTAHLDVRAEAELYDRFLELTAGLTTIVISHRFSTVRRADRIVVLDHGRIAEDGSHDELMMAGGRYARMFRLQASSYASAVDPDSGDPDSGDPDSAGLEAWR